MNSSSNLSHLCITPLFWLRFQLDESDLAGLQDLELLDLSNNFLTQVPADALRRLTQLKTLVLHSNLIQVGRRVCRAFTVRSLTQGLGHRTPGRTQDSGIPAGNH